MDGRMGTKTLVIGLGMLKTVSCCWFRDANVSTQYWRRTIYNVDQGAYM